MNRATHANAVAVGVLFAIGGMTHGLLEALQGNAPTGGPVISAVPAGSGWSRWTEGAEAAFTVIPNYLLTGLVAMAVSVALLLWSLRRLHTPAGPRIYLLLFVLLFLTGGGIGQVLFFIPGWAVATRIHKPLSWWRQALPPSLRRPLAQAWPWLLGIAAGAILAALFVSNFGWIPAVHNMDQVTAVMVSLVGASLLFFLLAFVAGFARDLDAAFGPAHDTAATLGG